MLLLLWLWLWLCLALSLFWWNDAVGFMYVVCCDAVVDLVLFQCDGFLSSRFKPPSFLIVAVKNKNSWLRLSSLDYRYCPETCHAP